MYFWRLSVTGSLHSCRPLPIEGSNHTLAVCMSSDGTLIASSYTDASVTLWDPRPGGKLRRLPQQAASMFSLSFCDNEHRLVTYGVDKTVAFWSLGEELPIARKLEDLPLVSRETMLEPGCTLTLTSISLPSDVLPPCLDQPWLPWGRSIPTFTFWIRHRRQCKAL